MQGRDQSLWRRRLSREVAGLVVIKLVALTLLWWLFFSPAHRTAVDANAAGRRLGVGAVATRADARAESPAAQVAPRD